MFAWLPAHHLQRLPVGGLGAVQPSQWFTSGCTDAAQARWKPDGYIEVLHAGQQGTDVLQLPKAVLGWAPLIKSAAAKANVPASLVAGIMATESGGKSGLSSYAGAGGLMGLMPATASEQAGRTVTPEELLSNTTLNVELGAKLIGKLLDQYKGNIVKVAIAYNAGSVKCGAPKKCPDSPNKWNAVTDCDGPSGVGGKSVDYPARTFGYANSWVESGVEKQASPPSSLSGPSSSYVELGLKIAAVVGLAYVVAPGMFPSWKKAFK